MSTFEPQSVVTQLRTVGVDPSAGILQGKSPTKTWRDLGSDGKPKPLMYIVEPPLKDPEREPEGAPIIVAAEKSWIVWIWEKTVVKVRKRRIAYNIFIIYIVALFKCTSN